MDQETWALFDQSHMLTLCTLLYSGDVGYKMHKAKFWSLISHVFLAVLQFSVFHMIYSIFLFLSVKYDYKVLDFFLHFPELYCIIACFRKKRVVSTFKASASWKAAFVFCLLIAHSYCIQELWGQGHQEYLPSSSLH